MHTHIWVVKFLLGRGILEGSALHCPSAESNSPTMFLQPRVLLALSAGTAQLRSAKFWTKA